MHTFPEGISSAFSPDGSLLATITSDNEVSIWKISDWSLFSALKKDESTYNYGYSFAYFVSNKQIITGDLWNKNKNKIWRFSGDSAYHQDFVGPYTGIISGDNTFFVYMEQTGSKIFIHLWGISP
jgi:WD40 repeat protein